MAGYKRPYPDSWGPGYYPPGDRPPPPLRPYGDSYHSGAPWPGYYPDRPRPDYPHPPPRDYYRPPRPATDDYHPSPAPPRHNYGRDPPPPGTGWDRPPPPKREYDPRPPSYSMGKDNNMPPAAKPESKEENIDFTDDYSAIYWSKQSNNDRGGGGQSRGHRGRGFSRWDNPKPKHESNKPAQGQSSGQGQFGDTKQGQFSSQGKGHDSGGHQSQGRGGFQGQSRGRGNDRGHGRGGRGSFRGSGSDRGRGRGRGMPPSHFGSRGRGKGKPSNVPPVHSLAKAKTTLMDVAAMSKPEKLHRFCLYVKEDRNQKGNSIQTITNAITSSKLGLKIEFEPSGLAWVSNTKVTTGTLTLDGVFLARSIGMSKKELKMSVFDKALDVMKTKTVAEIYNLKDEGPDYFRDQILGDLRDKDMDDKKAPAPSENESPLVKLVNYVKSKPADSHDNAISFIEQACAQFCFLTSYKFEFQSATNILHKGKFTYDDIVLATGHGESKKKCKKSVYEEVFRRLTTCTIEELKESVPEPNLEEVSLLLQTHKKETPKLQIRDKPLEQRLEEFLTGLKSKTASSNSPVSTIDVIAKSCGLYAMLIFKPTTDMKLCLSTKCDLYIENIYISSGQAVKKKDSILPAYLKAFEILTITTAEEILDETKFRRLRDEELHDPKSKDILFKGTGKTLESNLENLTRNGYDTDNLTNTMEDDFVIVEHHGWSVERTKHAFMILQHSCSQNGLFLQWQSEPVMTHNTYKCIVFINGIEVSSSYGFGRLHSKSLACMEALYKLYETYDAILINQYEEIKDYMDYTNLKDKVAELRMSGITPVSSLKVDDEETNLVDPYFSTLIQQLLDDLEARNKDHDDLEIRIGPGFSPSEWLEVKYRVRAMNMRYWIQHKNDGEQEEVFIIMKKMPWKDLARILKNREGNISGKYELLVGDKKPKYSEVKDLIMKEFAALQDPNLKDVKHMREVIMSKKEKKKAAKNKAEFEAIDAEQDLQIKIE